MEPEGTKTRFSNKLVVVSATAIFLYTAMMFVLAVYNIQNKTNTWPPAELTALWYGFWTVELVSLTTIKVSKIRNKYEKEEITTVETVKEVEHPDGTKETIKETKEIK